MTAASEVNLSESPHCISYREYERPSTSAQTRLDSSTVMPVSYVILCAEFFLYPSLIYPCGGMAHRYRSSPYTFYPELDAGFQASDSPVIAIGHGYAALSRFLSTTGSLPTCATAVRSVTRPYAPYQS